ncbi:MAG: LCP family protein [Candidatus Microbacterium stercoravium]
MSSSPAQTPGTPTKRRTGRRILIIAAVVVAVIAITAGVAIARLSANVTTVDLGSDGDAPANVSDYSGSFDLLLVGSDGRDGQGAQYGEGSDVEGARNDVTLMLHVNESHDRASVISFPRDLLIDFPDCTDPSTGRVVPGASGVQFNEALDRGGLGCVASAVEALTGTNTHYAAEISFQGVIELSHTVGGVPVCFEGAIDDPLSGLVVPEAGTYDLEGEQALAFLRSRHGVGDGSDLARISSQQVFMSGLVRKLQEDATFTDLVTLYSIADVATKNSTLSTDLADPLTMVSMAKTLADLPLEETTFVTYPYLPSGNRVVPDEAAAEQLLGLIETDQPIVLDADHLGRGRSLEESPEDQPTGAPDEGAETEATVPENVDGQSADERTCVIPF